MRELLQRNLGFQRNERIVANPDTGDLMGENYAR
jgi:hypothetical protein